MFAIAMHCKSRGPVDLREQPAEPAIRVHQQSETMKIHFCIPALAMLATAFAAQAHELEPVAKKIVVICQEGRTPQTIDVANAIYHSDYSATPSARREMLTRANHACASGWKGVTFVPPADQRYGMAAAN